jgi:glutamyl-Q tRNA(Asp) synthetase
LTAVVTRFAPSPTGLLHLGHAFSALTAWQVAQASEGTFLLRIEDLDPTRSRPDYEAAIYRDLAWLGLSWPEPVLRQSDCAPAYVAALDRLRALGVAYPCTCTRRDIAAAALTAPQEGAPAPGVYAGTCRGRTDAPAGAAWRLDLAAAIDHLGGAAAVAGLAFRETGPEAPGQHALDAADLLRTQGDVILGRKESGAAYHLAVVVDDAAQGVTHVVRGADLLPATPLHRLLQALLDLPVPVWHHHRLIRDASGRRLAKRDDARALATLRSAGATPAQVRALLADAS